MAGNKERTQPGLPGFSTVELVSDLKTGEKRLRTRSRRRTASEPTPHQRAQAMEQWWSQGARYAFLQAAENFKQSEGVNIAERSGQNVEFFGHELGFQEAETKLRQVIAASKGLPINTLEITEKFKAETNLLRNQHGARSSWLGSFLDWTISIMAKELKLSMQKTLELKTFAHQPHFKGFN